MLGLGGDLLGPGSILSERAVSPLHVFSDMAANLMTANLMVANLMTANLMTANLMTANLMTANLWPKNGCDACGACWRTRCPLRLPPLLANASPAPVRSIL
jgi:uncharacterized protein YjbI with pentapeptide repeats